MHNKKKTNLHIYESDEEHENEQREREGEGGPRRPIYIPGEPAESGGKEEIFNYSLIGLEPLWSASW